LNIAIDEGVVDDKKFCGLPVFLRSI